MIDQRAYQCNRRRSLVLWRGGQWSVTSNGLETTDRSVPHLVIPPKDFDREHDILNGRYAPALPISADWFNRGEFEIALANARALHRQPAGALR